MIDPSAFLKDTAAFDMELPENRVFLDKSTLEAWLKAYRELRRENKILLRYLREKFPELKGISFENGLNIEEIEKILKNKKKIVDYLYKL